MSKVGISALRTFLKTHAQTSAARSVLQDMLAITGEYGAFARKGALPLKIPSRVALARTRKAITSITGVRVDDLVFLRANDPNATIGWMPARKGQLKKGVARQHAEVPTTLSRQALANWMDSSVKKKRHIWELSVRVHADPFWEALGEPLGDLLLDALDKHLFDALLDSFYWGTSVDLLGTNLHACIRAPMFSALGFTIAGDVERARLFQTYLRVAQHAIPLGEKDGAPGTWIVVTA